MEGRQRRSFTDDYKRQAVDLVASSGRSIGSVAKELSLRDNSAAEFCVASLGVTTLGRREPTVASCLRNAVGASVGGSSRGACSSATEERTVAHGRAILKKSRSRFLLEFGHEIPFIEKMPR